MTPEQVEHNRQVIAALRSGKYQQGRMKLRPGNSFCCLGVACDVSGLGKWRDDGGYAIGVECLHTTINKPLKDWLGVESRGGPRITIDGSTSEAYNHNDVGRTFAQIADAWEAWLNEQEVSA